MAAVTSAQTPSELPKLVETVDVRVINIDVVVTDRKGKHVPNLTIEDFELFENGRPVKLTNFYSVNRTKPKAVTTTIPGPKPATETPEEVPQQMKRKIIFFVDNLSLAPFNRNRVFKSMKEFAKELMQPGDEAMVATWNRSMKIRVPFTSDPTQVQQALEAISGESALGLQMLSERRSAESQVRDAEDYQQAIAAARGYAQSIDHDLRQTVGALNGLMTTLAGVEGKKVLVLTSEGFPLQPGRELFYYIDEIKNEKQNWRSQSSTILEGMSFNAVSTIQSVAKTANANGITLYTLHAGGLAGMNEGSAENSQPVSYNVSQAALSNSTDSLAMLAEMTGGRSVIGTNNFGDGFRKIEMDLGNYYSLGYRSGTERVDRQRSVNVRMRNRAYIGRARQSFVEKSIPSEMTDKVRANLFYDNKTNDMKVFLTTGRPVMTEDGTFKVPVEIHIPMESLALIPTGEMVSGGFTVFVGASNKDGDMSDIQQQNHSIRIPANEMKKLEGKHYTYALELIMEKGRNRISVGVVDSVSNLMGFERQEVLAADLR